jgi:hypothetical protein
VDDVAHQVHEAGPAGPRTPVRVQDTEPLRQGHVIGRLEVEARGFAAAPDLDRILVREPVR